MFVKPNGTPLTLLNKSDDGTFPTYRCRRTCHPIDRREYLHKSNYFTIPLHYKQYYHQENKKFLFTLKQINSFQRKRCKNIKLVKRRISYRDCNSQEAYNSKFHYSVFSLKPFTFLNCYLNSVPLILLFSLVLLGLAPIKTTSSLNSIINQQSKHSGQFHISQLCAGKSQFPVIKRVEGAVLSSVGDSDVNCSITFRTKSAHQHFAIRFEKLKLGCYDHLKMVDGDLDYGPLTIKDFSCKDSLATVPLMKTTGTYLTLRFTTDNRTQESDGFRFVITALFDSNSDCPADYSYCKNQFCISKYLFCDEVNHCIDGSDEGPDCSRFATSLDPNGYIDGTYRSIFDKQDFGSSFMGGGSLFNLTNAVILLGFIIFIIVIVTLIVLWCINCRVDQSAYAQYQHQLQRSIGVPIQSSASLMFNSANHHQSPNGPQFQYQYFQPQISPYVTPQHHQAAALAAATLPRGYSTLPINHLGSPAARQQQPNKFNPQVDSQVAATNHQNTEYLMMTGLTPNQTLQTNLFLPNSQSIIATTGLTTTRYPMNGPTSLHQ